LFSQPKRAHPMQLATWLAVIILGPGSIAIFLWFLADLKRILGRD
jgi:hypothetical protein